MMAKERNYASVWTAGLAIYLRKDKDKDSEVIRVKTADDLKKI
jgi:hypothetical protein